MRRDERQAMRRTMENSLGEEMFLGNSLVHMEGANYDYVTGTSAEFSEFMTMGMVIWIFLGREI